MRLAAVSTGAGVERVHAYGCADVARDMRRYARHNMPYPMTLDVTSRLELARELWSDVCGGETDPGTPEHDAQCLECLEDSTEVLPCVRFPEV